MSDEMQALCFLTGANSIFTGDVLLTAGNPEDDADARLFAKLVLRRSRQSIELDDQKATAQVPAE